MGAIDRLARQARQVAAGGCDEVPSPCVSICRMDPSSELCEGCFRTLDEIALWGRMEEKSKREVWKQIGQRINLAQAEGERKSA
jgi:predicted Fe-S protein YdhL (DUF1289 family)